MTGRVSRGELRRRSFDERLVWNHPHRGRGSELRNAVNGCIRRLSFQDVRWKRQMGRSGAASSCHADRAAGGFRHRRRRVDPCVPLGYRPKETLLIQLGENAATLLVDRRIGGQTEQRDCRALRLGNTGQDVGSAAAARTFADTDTPTHAGINVGHEGRRSLIPGHDVLDRTSSVAKGVIKGHPGIAGKPKHMLDAGSGENIDERSRPLHRQLPLPLAPSGRFLARTAM